MDISVADVIALIGGNKVDVSSFLPHGIAPGAKLVMRRERAAAEEVMPPVFCNKVHVHQ